MGNQDGLSKRQGFAQWWFLLLMWASLLSASRAAQAAEELRINEFLGANRSVQADVDGQFSDWIEIANTTAAPVNLQGWALTDDPGNPAKWVFPGVSIPPNGFLLVFASGKDRSAAGAELHTNFKIAAEEGYLALIKPDGATYASELSPYPEQRPNVSYGHVAATSLKYFTTPTPGQANNAGVEGFVGRPKFSHPHGHYDSSFRLSLSSETPGAVLFYTTNGTPAHPTNGTLYTAPLIITNTTVLSVVATKEGMVPSPAVSQSYLFLDSILRQTGTGHTPIWIQTYPYMVEQAIALVPNAFNFLALPILADYAMDPNIVDNPAYRDRIKNDLRSLPVISIVMNEDDLFGAENGIYSNPHAEGDAWERPASVEYFYPDGRKGFQVNCGIKTQGELSRNNLFTPKKSFRLLFQENYGPTKLDFPLFEDTLVRQFDVISLRGSFIDSWGLAFLHDLAGNDLYADWRNGAQYVRDQYLRQVHELMGNHVVHGNFAHLYLNGMYWGFYNMVERPNDSFAATYFGGAKEEYDVIIDGPEVRSGEATAFNDLMTRLRADMTNPANYARVEEMLDIPNFISYMMVNIWGAHTDWPVNNWTLMRRRAAGEKFKAVVWDIEFTLYLADYNYFAEDYHKDDTFTEDCPSEIFLRLSKNPEFRLQFADLAHKWLFNNGLLTPGPAKTLYEEVAAKVDGAVVAESARWGDYRKDPAYTRNDNWVPSKQQVLNNFLNGRASSVVGYLRGASLYPNVAAPVFNQHGGTIPKGFQLTMNSGPGKIYYTLNGTDPRVPGTGAVSANAVEYIPGSPVILNFSSQVKARTLSGTTWSALNEATFFSAEMVLPLHFTEIMYNPEGGNAYEFLEIQNRGNVPIDLGGMTLEGVDYRFPYNRVLNPSQIIVIASGVDPAAFRTRYAGVEPAGFFSGNLNNDGEVISLKDRAGRTITSIDYRDDSGWPEAADGKGYSLEIADLRGDATQPTSWRIGKNPGGTPGKIIFPPASSSIQINEVFASANSLAYQGSVTDWIELYNNGSTEADVSGWIIQRAPQTGRFVLPSGTTLPARSYLVVVCDVGPGLRTGFRLDRDGDGVILLDREGLRVDAFSFGPQVDDRSSGKFGSDWKMAKPTPGAANELAPIVLQLSLSINEWRANPLTGEDDFIEIYNKSPSTAVSLQGIHLSDGKSIARIPWVGFLGPKSFLSFKADDKMTPGHLPFKLSGTGGTLILYDSSGTMIESLSYGPQAEGASRGRLPDGADTFQDFLTTASPGASNYLPSDYTGPILNEILARSSRSEPNPIGRVTDWVELHNPSDFPFNMAGMSLSVDSSNHRWIAPSGLTIPAKGFLLLSLDDHVPDRVVQSPTLNHLNARMTLNGSGDGISLFDAKGRRVDYVRFGFQVRDRSIGRINGAWALMGSVSPGGPNSSGAAISNPGELYINEWQSHDSEGDPKIEIFNNQTSVISLSGYHLTDEASLEGKTKFRFPALSFLDGKEFLTLIADGNTSAGRDHLPFTLNQEGNGLRLYGFNFQLMDSLDLGPQPASGSAGRYPDASTNTTSFPGSATFGLPNAFALTQPVIIQEILNAASDPFEQAIELFNPGNDTLDLTGWYLSDNPLQLKKHKILGGTGLAGRGTRVFYQSNFQTFGGMVLDGIFGGTVFLSEADANGNLTGRQVRQEYGPSLLNTSQGTFPTSLGPRFGAMSGLSFGKDQPASLQDFRTGTGKANPGPAVGPIVINEIMYHPPEVTGTEETWLEYIELKNVGSQDVTLYGSGSQHAFWQVSGGVRMQIGVVTLRPNESVLLVSFDPNVDSPARTAFRNFYKLSSLAKMSGPFDGSLANSSDSIRLHQPAPALPNGYIPLVLVEEVNYRDRNPWPSEADGKGKSLHRKNVTGAAPDPVHWLAGAPSPTEGQTAGGDSDGDGIPDEWEQQYGLNPQNRSDGNLDSDGDGLTNLQEYKAGTNPLDPSDGLRIGPISRSLNQVEIRIPIKAGKSYVVQTKTTLSDAAWTDWKTIAPESSDTVKVLQDTLSSGTRFYRLKAP